MLGNAINLVELMVAVDWAANICYDMRIKMKAILFTACAAIAGFAYSDSTPVMVSLVTPVQAPSRHNDVRGVRLSLIYGECEDFRGLDIGIANNTRGSFKGLAIGGANIVDSRMLGGQIGLVNWNGYDERAWGGRSTGAQFGILNMADSFCGLQDGFANFANDSFAGLQTSFFNVSGDLYGAQIGYYFIFGVNITGEFRGCQVGLVNYAESVDCGLQIGLVNIIGRNGWARVLPFVNGRF